MQARMTAAHGYIKAIAVDYDGTLTANGPADDAVVDALERARADGLVVVLVTGRILSELESHDRRILDVPDAIVAENGAVLRIGGHEHLLAPPVDDGLLADIWATGVPARRGRVIVAAQLADRAVFADSIVRRSLDLQLLANRSELMVVPAGTTKASGLRRALSALGRDLHNTLAIGDAENDLAMLAASEVAVAVANAVPSVRRAADIVTAAPAGAGVIEALSSPVVRAGVGPGRWRIEVGVDDDTGETVWLPAAGTNLLVSGPSGGGKSWASGMLIEQLVVLGYSVLVLDPQGDHEPLGDLAGVALLGDNSPFPGPAQVLGMLLHGPGSIVVDLSQRGAADRSVFLQHLPDMATACAAATGRPHWLVIDEAHGALAALVSATLLADRSISHLIVTYKPQQLPEDLWRWIDGELIVGASPDALAVLRWPLDASPRRVRLRSRSTSHIRHWHKYRTELLPHDRGFFFRDENGRSTGAVALSLAELCGELVHCDTGVMRHHAQGQDFSRWIRDVFRDPALARSVAEAERRVASAPNGDDGRRALLLALEHRTGLGSTRS
jgi:hydroxymethylpyrimidine pyrophosphatase-like HAD family hydrolase